MRCMTDLLYCALASGRNLNVYGNWFVRRYVRRGGVCDYCACTTAKCCRSEERNNNTNYNSNLVELSAHARFSVLSSRISRQQLSQRKKHNDKRGSAYPTRKRTRTTMGTARAEPKKKCFGSQKTLHDMHKTPLGKHFSLHSGAHSWL